MEYKKLRLVTILDGFVVLFANLISVVVPKIFGAYESNNIAQTLMNQYQISNWCNLKWLYIPLFYIPLLLCLLYVTPKDKTQFPKRFINIPIMYAICGTTGWLMDVLAGGALIIYAGQKLNIDIGVILFNRILYSVLSAMISFIMSFFGIEFIHRVFILPKYFSEGHFSKYNYKIRPSFRMVAILVYITVAFFPITVLWDFFIDLFHKNPDPVYYKKFGIVFLLLICGIFIYVSFIRYVSKPVMKLMAGANFIKDGIYNQKIDCAGNDEFGDLTDTFNDMADSLREKNEKITVIQNSIIKGMAMMVESRDNSTGGHINRTSAYVQLFAKHLLATGKYPQINDDFVQHVMKAAPMHDLGKIAVDDAVLRKPGKFTDEEYEKMKAHAAEGARIVNSVLKEVDNLEFKKIAVNVAHYHHEKWNGAGYPTGIKGEEIPLEARIMALADVYDALVSKRCYKDQFSFDKAFDIIRDSLGSHFDPDLGAEFLSLRSELEELTCMLAE